jgi:hypothetical protein
MVAIHGAADFSLDTPIDPAAADYAMLPPPICCEIKR